MKVYHKLLMAALLLVAAIIFSDEAYAQSCTVSVLSSVVFGTYDSLLTGNLDTTASVGVNCSKPGQIASFTLTMGKGSAASYTPRRMFKGSESLNYNLYLDAAYSTIWGDGTSGTSFITETKVKASQTYTVYARTPLGQDVSAGIYSDVVTVTVTF